MGRGSSSQALTEVCATDVPLEPEILSTGSLGTAGVVQLANEMRVFS